LAEGVRTGVYICHCGTNIAGTIDVKALRQYAEELSSVNIARDYVYLCSEPGQQLIRKDVERRKINRVVIAACSPSLHEPTFRRVLDDEGLNPYFLEIANIREQDSWVHIGMPEKSLEVAKDLLRMAVARAERLEGLRPREVQIGKRILILGGGIAGISAAIDLAKAGFHVHLVEKTPSIGGKMAQLDRTFPSFDSSSCILTPKMVEVAKHPNIDLITYAELEEIQGHVGNFKAKILKKPRYVDEKRCTICGACAKVCPVEVPDEFNAGLGWRKAIYIPFPQAVPSAYVLDEKSCLGLTPLACGRCREVCAFNAIDYDQIPREIELSVDTIIVATGYEVYEPSGDRKYGYGTYPNVLTALEMERLLSVGGPTQGRVLRPSDLKEPRSVAYVQCVGSTDGGVGNYCSRICCMYTIKQVRQLKERSRNIDVCILYGDLAAPLREFEELFGKAARNYEIQLVRGGVAEIREDPKTKTLTLIAKDQSGKNLEVKADMVVLSIGIRPSKDTKTIQKILKIPTGVNGFFSEAHPLLRPADTLVDGVFVCGTCTGPKDIGDSVAQAKAAASSATTLMTPGKYVVEPYYAKVDELLCGGCGICASICPYDAVTIKEKKARINEALCRGCGVCAAACPAAAVETNNFTDEQIMSQVEQAIAR